MFDLYYIETKMNKKISGTKMLKLGHILPNWLDRQMKVPHINKLCVTLKIDGRQK